MASACRLSCNLCDDPGSLDEADEVVEINCNVRRFAAERFVVWRCRNCRSIHSRDVLDLNPYYDGYPFQKQHVNLVWRLISRAYLRRLKAAGLRRSHELLDYGCGSGLLVNWLRSKGYRRARGVDAYSPGHGDRATLQRKYDFVVVQDVIEHVEEPAELLDELTSLTRPGGLICIGTPNAEAIDLTHPRQYVHSLHQPYHVHVLSEAALRALARTRGLCVERCYHTAYADTFTPGINVRFGYHYAGLFDNTLDLAFEPPRWSLRLLTPRAAWLALFGRLRPVRSEMTLFFRTPE